jgi:hypothetical protein
MSNPQMLGFMGAGGGFWLSASSRAASVYGQVQTSGLSGYQGRRFAQGGACGAWLVSQRLRARTRAFLRGKADHRQSLDYPLPLHLANPPPAPTASSSTLGRTGTTHNYHRYSWGCLHKLRGYAPSCLTAVVSQHMKRLRAGFIVVFSLGWLFPTYLAVFNYLKFHECAMIDHMLWDEAHSFICPFLAESLWMTKLSFSYGGAVAACWLTYLFTRMRALEKPANQPPQHNASSRPSSQGLSASETPSSLGPRG